MLIKLAKMSAVFAVKRGNEETKRPGRFVRALEFLGFLSAQSALPGLPQSPNQKLIELHKAAAQFYLSTNVFRLQVPTITASQQIFPQIKDGLNDGQALRNRVCDDENVNGQRKFEDNFPKYGNACWPLVVI
jgi:hypothetical protein